MQPFENDAEVLTIDGMSIENGTQAVVLHGSLEIARDKASLDRARRLRDCLNDMIAVLENRSDLPATADRPPPRVERKPNPLKG